MAVERIKYPKYPEEDGVVVLSVEPYGDKHQRINFNDDTFLIVEVNS